MFTVFGVAYSFGAFLVPMAYEFGAGSAATSERDPEFEERYGVQGYLVPPEETAAFARTQFERRMRVLERARTQSKAELRRELAEEMDAEARS